MRLVVLEAFLEFIDRDYPYRSLHYRPLIVGRSLPTEPYYYYRALVYRPSYTFFFLFFLIRLRTQDGTTRRNVSFRLGNSIDLLSLQIIPHVCVSLSAKQTNANLSNRTIERNCIGPTINVRRSFVRKYCE